MHWPLPSPSPVWPWPWPSGSVLSQVCTIVRVGEQFQEGESEGGIRKFSLDGGYREQGAGLVVLRTRGRRRDLKPT